MKRASYKNGVEWIAKYDEPKATDLEFVTYQISVMLLADLFGKLPEQVAHDVIFKRNQLLAESETEKWKATLR